MEAMTHDAQATQTMTRDVARTGDFSPSPIETDDWETIWVQLRQMTDDDVDDDRR